MTALRWPLLILVAGIVLALHLRLARRDAYLYREPAIPRHAQPRLVAVRIARELNDPERTADHVELEIVYGDQARSPTELTLPLGAGHVMAVELHDASGRQLPIKAEGFRDHSTLSFELPPISSRRSVRVGFFIDAPYPSTYGWGYRAAPNDWIPHLTPTRIPLSLQIDVPNGTNVLGWRCGPGEPKQELTTPDRVCSTAVKARRTIALPLARYDDVPSRLAFAGAIGIVISGLMYAIYRRWASLAAAMGADDRAHLGPLTMDEVAIEYRRLKARAAKEPEVEVDPLEAVALVARGIAGVLSIVGSIFLVSHFHGGLFPIPAPVALALWALAAGAVVILATGVDRPRPWIAVAITVVLAAIALHPFARFVTIGILPLAGGVLMQLTGKR